MNQDDEEVADELKMINQKLKQMFKSARKKIEGKGQNEARKGLSKLRVKFLKFKRLI